MPAKRLTFLCWNCKRTYSLLRQPVKGQVLFVACPFCGADGVSDLRPYKPATVTVFKAHSSGEALETPELDLPEVLPTQKPPTESET